MQLKSVLLLSVLSLLVGCAKTQVKSQLVEGTGQTQECVVLLHGLARSADSMRKLGQAFSAAGYRTLNIDYPSTNYPNQVLLDKFIAPSIAKNCPPNHYTLHFVGHSMGGIQARLYMQQVKPPKPGAVVAIASPHLGTKLVNRLGWLPVFKWINGEAGYEMASVECGNGDDCQKEALPNTLLGQLSAPSYPLLAIVGTASLNPLYSALIPGDDDGKVSVKSASLTTAAEIFTVSASHTFIMKNPKVIEAAVRFIAGR